MKRKGKLREKSFSFALSRVREGLDSRLITSYAHLSDVTFNSSFDINYRALDDLFSHCDPFI